MKQVTAETHLDAWRRFYVAFWRVTAAIEADLAAANLPSLSWYDALYQLYLAPDRRLPMSQLAHGALLSRSGLTRLVDRLEKDGLIERKACASDGRVLYAVLTDKGLGTLRAIWKGYRAGVMKHFAVSLSEADAKTLTEILARVAKAAETADRD